MSTNEPLNPAGVVPDTRVPRNPATAQRRRWIRYLAALLAGATAILYFLIGFNQVAVIDTPADQIFGIPAGIAYALGAVLLVAYPRRIVWGLGAALQIFVIYTYFNLASQRTPAYEIWGIVIRVIQLLILVALAYLALRPPASPDETQV